MDESEISYEPMDVDLSSRSVSAMDISYVETNFEFPPVNIKKEKEDNDIVIEKCLNITPLTISNLIANHSKNHKRKITDSIYFSRIMICIIVLLISIMAYHVPHFKCSQNLDINMLKKTLSSKIYGQKIATENLIKAINLDVGNKIIILYGGTGVGKTYTASIILENILEYSNIYHYTMPLFSQTSFDFMHGLIFCQSSMFIVDDLHRNDILNAENQIKYLIDKSEKYSKNITIMLIYNCDTMDEQYFRKCDETFLLELRKSLSNIASSKYYIKYESLTEEHLRMCIENELSNKKLSESDIHNIMKNFNVTIDGCKGVYQKMKYLSII